MFLLLVLFATQRQMLGYSGRTPCQDRMYFPCLVTKNGIISFGILIIEIGKSTMSGQNVLSFFGNKKWNNLLWHPHCRNWKKLFRSLNFSFRLRIYANNSSDLFTFALQCVKWSASSRYRPVLKGDPSERKQMNMKT